MNLIDKFLNWILPIQPVEEVPTVIFYSHRKDIPDVLKTESQWNKLGFKIKSDIQYHAALNSKTRGWYPLYSADEVTQVIKIKN